MRYFLDTEFDETAAEVTLISIALVCEDGREFYAVNNEIEHKDDCNPWVQEHVWPVLFSLKDVTTQIASADLIRSEIEAFVGDDQPEFWGYVADYDWMLFARLWGTLMGMPKGWPFYCLDLKQEARRLWVMPKDCVPVEQPEHNALVDARWNKRLYHFLAACQGSPL